MLVRLVIGPPAMDVGLGGWCYRRGDTCDEHGYMDS